VRSTLPPELRAWAQEQVPLLPLYGFLSFTGLSTSIMTASLASTGSVGLGLPAVSLAFVVLPLVPIGLFQVRKTRRALAAGYRLADLRFALRAWITERRSTIDQPEVANGSEWVRFGTHVPLLSIAVALLASGLSGLAIAAQSDYGFLLGLNRLAVFVAVASAATLTALGLPIAAPSLQRRLVGRTRSWLWNGRIGEWLARRLTPKIDGVPVAAFRPTEMALNLAIEDLFSALPNQYRESLVELPAVARRLTARVSELREVGHRLSTHGAPTSGATTNAARLTETVTALERLRLGLLRLHGGLADMRPLTTALAAAKALDHDVALLVDAQAEVSGMRTTLAFERRTPSPA
jgi:hypothetical protein